MKARHPARLNPIHPWTPGMCLVELMVALAIGMAVVGATITIYVNTRHAWSVQDNLGRLQENGRFALHILREDLRLAGYWGLNISPVTIINAEPIILSNECASGWATRYTYLVESGNNSNAGYASCIPDSDYSQYTDILTLRRASSESIVIDEIASNNVYLLTSLTEGIVFMADADAQLDDAVELEESPTALHRVLANAYYVRPYSQQKGDGIPTLMREVISAGGVSAEPLAELVEDLQITFGLDSNGDGGVDIYDNDGIAAEETSKVVTIVVEILVRSAQPVAGYINTRKFRIGDRVRTFSDGFIRQLFRDAVYLRNHPGADA